MKTQLLAITLLILSALALDTAHADDWYFEISQGSESSYSRSGPGYREAGTSGQRESYGLSYTDGELEASHDRRTWEQGTRETAASSTSYSRGDFDTNTVRFGRGGVEGSRRRGRAESWSYDDGVRRASRARADFETESFRSTPNSYERSVARGGFDMGSYRSPYASGEYGRAYGDSYHYASDPGGRRYDASGASSSYARGSYEAPGGRRHYESRTNENWSAQGRSAFPYAPAYAGSWTP